ncbi:hypothetical protein GR157_01370 [Burkholderia sp. 4701]|nr:hypothetical protein [Burkholderia sp. 4701]MXN81284.1 hypothetical protein [Burkholderia sp. 4812]
MKLTLAKRVNFRCSVCDAHTVGPKTGTQDKEFSVGKAAHIKAAAQGGPRYDPVQSPEERASIENGLWACATCADLIDRDADAYSVEQLHQIKEEAERLARRRVGRSPEAALPALQSPSAIQGAIEALCRREAAQQELIDPRFKVSVRMSETGFVYELNAATEPIDARIVVGARGKPREMLELRDFFDYGGTQDLVGLDVRIEGSPLFFSGNIDRLQLSSRPRPMTMTMALEDEGRPLFIEFIGNGTNGHKGFRFKGAAMGGMLSAVMTADYDGTRADFSLSCNLLDWARKPVTRLPHFARLQGIFQVLASPTKAQLQCAHGGIEVDFGVGVLDGSEHFLPLRVFFEEVAMLRTLNAFFGLDLTLPANLDDVMRDRGDMSELLALINLEKTGQREIQLTLVPTDSVDEFKQLVANRTATAIRLSQPLNLQIFDKSYGPFDVEMICPAAIVQPIGPIHIEPGIPAQLTVIATEGHCWSARVANAITS